MLSFSASTVVGSAPSREDLAAALPESERGSAAVYLRHFPSEARYSNGGMYAPYWAKAYLTRKGELDQASISASTLDAVVNSVQNKQLIRGERFSTAADILTGMSEEDEHRICELFGRQTTFGPGLSFLLEDRRIERMAEFFEASGIGSSGASTVMDVMVAPSEWKKTDDFDTFVLRCIYHSSNHSYAEAWMEAARRIAPGIQVAETLELHKRFDLKGVRQLAEAGVPLEYALA